MYHFSTVFTLKITHVATLALALAVLPSAAQTTDNTGRKALTDSLNQQAFAETAKRREAMSHVTTKAQAEARQREVRATMLRLMGPLPTRIPLNPRTLGSTQQEGFRVDKVMFDSQPNFPVTALLYVPNDATGSHNFPAIVMAPGHSPAGKAGDVAFATAFAKAGFIVLSYDPIGQGERLQYLDPKSPADKPVSLASRPTGEHGEAGLQPTLLGDALARYFLWDGMRAVDFLEAQPNVDPKRIGAFGCSGGGTMTALLAGLDTRVAAAGVACYTTSWDALLVSATGVQDSEQSTANAISSGLDFPDWSELFAPRPYAIIATTNDMFPFDGAKATEAESRSFYRLFQADQNLAFITGPGGHGNLRPILPQILHFFADHLHPDARYAAALPPITDPFAPAATPATRPAFPPPPPASLVQVTPTGQLASSYPGTATVFTLNQARAKTIATPHPATLAALQKAVREVTHAEVLPGAKAPLNQPLGDGDPDHIRHRMQLHVSTGIDLPAEFYRPEAPGKHPELFVLRENLDPALDATTRAGEIAKFRELAKQGTAVFVFAPRPTPPGTEETKSPILGTFYLTGLRAQLVGKTLLGMRVDDVISALNFAMDGSSVDPANVMAEASGHLGLVLLHAAVLDPRLKHVSIRGALASYRGLLDVPLPMDVPQDILPGVLQHYDIPELVRILGRRATFESPRSGAETDISLP